MARHKLLQGTECTFKMFPYEAVFSLSVEYWPSVRSDWPGCVSPVPGLRSEEGRSVMNTDTSQLQTLGAGGHTLTADRHTLKHTYNLVTLKKLENKAKVESEVSKDKAFCKEVTCINKPQTMLS